MGLGKTLQAIGVLSFYRSLYPALVIVPSSLRYQWKAALLQWMEGGREGGEGGLNKGEVCVVEKGTDVLYGWVVIVSYDLAVRFKDADRIKEGDYKVGREGGREEGEGGDCFV